MEVDYERVSEEILIAPLYLSVRSPSSGRLALFAAP
jgi:hypothetical protein